MDRIFLRDLTLACTIGVNDWERENPQVVIVNADLYLDLKPAGRTDDLNQSIDYCKIRDRIEIVVTESSFFLVEALAERIADACMEDGIVQSVRVSVEKPGILPSTRTAGVELYRERKQEVGGH